MPESNTPEITYKRSSALDYFQDLVMAELKSTKDNTRASALIALINMTQHTQLGSVSEYFNKVHEANGKLHNKKIVDAHSHYYRNPALGIGKMIGEAIAGAASKDPRFAVGGALLGGVFGLAGQTYNQIDSATGAESGYAQQLATMKRDQEASKRPKDDAKEDLRELKEIQNADHQSRAKLIS